VYVFRNVWGLNLILKNIYLNMSREFNRKLDQELNNRRQVNNGTNYLCMTSSQIIYVLSLYGSMVRANLELKYDEYKIPELMMHLTAYYLGYIKDIDPFRKMAFTLKIALIRELPIDIVFSATLEQFIDKAVLDKFLSVDWVKGIRSLITGKRFQTFNELETFILEHLRRDYEVLRDEIGKFFIERKVAPSKVIEDITSFTRLLKEINQLRRMRVRE